ncbi:two-component hybrid sensor and regulator [Thermosulfidibacter takaii ABI70S6]|uniref:histidine kinase n=1 Tax=Thermosulfidibacter takaii (strain DSM 17441 / JCM 13301 / NBRC 103674 / ABI70S6) TaxID=1298851 RepID=A0A0S3QU25_THET7|nr:ATP-binding protein [Thermosulfidibacter takaii]BAT71837.1 two-component hybrid sensor and regulator [Thermosulfidibacter takaii ABI70S6]
MAETEFIQDLLDVKSYTKEFVKSILKATDSDHGAVVIYNTKSDKCYFFEIVSEIKDRKIWEDIAKKCLQESEPSIHSLDINVIEQIICHPLTFSISGLKGVLILAKNKCKLPYTEKDKELLASKVFTVNLAINNKLLEDLAKENWRLLQMLSTLMGLFQQGKLKENLIESVLLATKKFFKADFVLLCRADESKKILKIIAYHGDPSLKDTISFDEGASGIAASTKEPCLIEEYHTDILPEACLNKASEIGSAMAIPILVKGELYGTLSLCRSKANPRFTVNEFNILRSFQILISFIFSLYEYEKERELFDQITFRTQKMEALGVLAGGIAHDFNNILNVILGFTQICMDKAKDNPEILEYLSIILDECKKAAALISQILYFSREDVGEKRHIDLKPLIKQFVKVVSRTIPENITVRYEDDGAENYYVLASPESLHAALMNIVANAKDAMPEGGQLLIALKKAYFDKNSPYPEKSVIIEITDTGIGIPEEHLDKIFDPFFTTKGSKGTGLGLYQTYNIIKNLQGTIDVESQPGRGTTFRIFLPEAEPSVENSKFYTIDSAPPTYPELDIKEEVLVVEDNEQLLNAILAMLKEIDVPAKGFSNPKEALEYFHENHQNIGVIVTDVVMPYLDGFKLADQMREIKPELKVIYITGYTNKAEELLSRSQEKGTFVILKPFSSFELVNAIKEVYQK